VKQFISYNKAGAAEVDNPDNIQMIEENRELVKEYPPNNVLNIDESGLF